MNNQMTLFAFLVRKLGLAGGGRPSGQVVRDAVSVEHGPQREAQGEAHAQVEQKNVRRGTRLQAFDCSL